MGHLFDMSVTFKKTNNLQILKSAPNTKFCTCMELRKTHSPGYLLFINISVLFFWIK